jgi:hypothetical protein
MTTKSTCSNCKRTKDNEKRNPALRIKKRLRNLLLINLKNYSKNGKTHISKKYGIDFEKIIEHLKPFPKDISKYHIDHIIPLSRFNLNNKNQIKIAFSPENHQWLLARENMSKKDKIIPRPEVLKFLEIEQ